MTPEEQKEVDNLRQKIAKLEQERQIVLDKIRALSFGVRNYNAALVEIINIIQGTTR